MPFKNIKKRRGWGKKWYLEHKEDIKKAVRERKRKIRKLFNEFRSGLKCIKCGENHPAVIDFHHHSGKEFEIAWMVANGYSMEKIKKEAANCQVLCSNCHRKTHYENKKL